MVGGENRLEQRVEAAYGRKCRTERTAVLVALCAGAALVFAGLFALDYLVRFPAPVRVLLTAVVLYVFAWRLPRRHRGHLSPPARDVVGMACVVEERAGHQRPGGFYSLVVSAVEFGGARPVSGSEVLKGRVVEEAQKPEYDPAGLVLHDPGLVRVALRAGAAFAAVYLVWGALGPHAMRTFFLRSLGLPAEYLTRTRIERVECPPVVAQYKDLRIGVQASGVLPPRGRVRVQFEGQSPFHVPLESPEGGGRYESWIKAPSRSFSLAVQLGDARGRPLRVRVVEPPFVWKGVVRATPPPYTGQQPADLDLGDVDVLEHSTVEWIVEPDRDVRECTLLLGTNAVAMAAKGGSYTAPPRTVAVSEAFTIRLVDRDGVENEERLNYTLTAVPDRLPAVTLAAPVQGAYYAPVSRLRWQVEASDDFGLRDLTVHYRIQRETEGGERTTIKEGDLDTGPTGGALEAARGGDARLGDLGAQPGMQVAFEARARDASPFRAAGDAGKSEERTVYVVTPEQLRAILEEEMVHLGKMLEDIKVDMQYQVDVLKQTGEGGR